MLLWVHECEQVADSTRGCKPKPPRQRRVWPWLPRLVHHRKRKQETSRVLLASSFPKFVTPCFCLQGWTHRLQLSPCESFATKPRCPDSKRPLSSPRSRRKAPAHKLSVSYLGVRTRQKHRTASFGLELWPPKITQGRKSGCHGNLLPRVRHEMGDAKSSGSEAKHCSSSNLHPKTPSRISPKAWLYIWLYGVAQRNHLRA